METLLDNATPMDTNITSNINVTPLQGTASHSFSLSERIAWLETHGQHCMSYSTLQPNMRYFDLQGVGFIGYRDWFGQRIVLSDPICAPHMYAHLIGQFLAHSPKKVCFIQVSSAVAQVLARNFGMYTTEFGQETHIHLEHWSLTGKKKQIFRTALNKAEQQSITIQEASQDPNPESRLSLDQHISDNWLNTRRCKQREIGFLIRPNNMPHQKDVRRFYGYQDNRPIGFVHFDPIYQAGQIIAYVPNISRANPCFKQGLFYAIMATALNQFKKEGVAFVNLGLSPLQLKGQDDPALRPSTALTRLLTLTRRFGHRAYNFDGIQFTKQRFRGEEQPTYVASHQALPIKAFLACLRLSNVL